MSTQPETLLAALDWDRFACQCTHHAAACPHPADYIVGIHAIGQCHQLGLRRGNRVEIRCHGCTVQLIAEVVHKLAEVNRRFGTLRCPGCEQGLATARDIIRDVTRL